MIPKEFYKEYMPLYTKDFDTEIYSTTQQSNSYRIGSDLNLFHSLKIVSKC